MVKYLFILVVLTTLISVQAFSQTATPKKEKLEEYRAHFAKNGYRSHDLRKHKGNRDETISALQEDGLFLDQASIIEKIIDEKWISSRNGKIQTKISDEIESAYRGYWVIAEGYRGKDSEEYVDDKNFRHLLNGIIKVGKMELERPDGVHGRFHSSCFAIPTAAINMYFCFFDLMEKVEAGTVDDPMLVEMNRVLKELGMQSWTQPVRNDDTDKNVVQVERFRNHVWWVGGNGIAYRSVLPCAAMMDSVEMMDVLAEVAKGAISSVSQNTYDEAFWTEGFTADGAGWGHGKQCLIWGYPIDGTNSALALLGFFKDSPWEGNLTPANVKALMNFFRGSSWYYHNGHIPPGLSRGSMAYFDEKKVNIPSYNLLKDVRRNWIDAFSQEEQRELKLLAQSYENQIIDMPEAPAGVYSGTRWFYNNDDLIKKTDDYHIFVNMASVRCDGMESAHTIADGYNFFTCDGAALFQKTGDEYLKAMGAWNLTAVPGVTSRQGEDQLSPIINWRGFCSKYNFAAAATSGSDNAVAGFIFEKMNASTKENVNDKQGLDGANQVIYGVKAHKFYFMFDDMMLALGAGIQNLYPEKEGDVWTTIDQTLWQGDINYSNGKKEIRSGAEVSRMVLKQAKQKGRAPLWISQKDGFAYAVLPEQTPGKVSFSAETRSTKWEKLNAGNKNKEDLPTSEQIFQVWINHGKNALNDSYGYLMYGGKENPADVYARSPVKVLSNTTDLQAASNTAGSVVGAAFYNKTSVLKTKKWELTVSAPCAVLVEMDNENCKLSVSDAEMNEDLEKIMIRTTLPLKGEGVERNGKWYIVAVAMPQGEDCGKPVTLEFVSFP